MLNKVNVRGATLEHQRIWHHIVKAYSRRSWALAACHLMPPLPSNSAAAPPRRASSTLAHFYEKPRSYSLECVHSLGSLASISFVTSSIAFVCSLGCARFRLTCSSLVPHFLLACSALSFSSTGLFPARLFPPLLQSCFTLYARVRCSRLPWSLFPVTRVVYPLDFFVLSLSKLILTVAPNPLTALFHPLNFLIFTLSGRCSRQALPPFKFLPRPLPFIFLVLRAFVGALRSTPP